MMMMNNLSGNIHESTLSQPIKVDLINNMYCFSRYGGPGSQLVSDRFRIDWGDYLASERGIIYASIDGRGSGYAGDKLLHSLYYGLGTAEVDDQLAVTA